MHIISVLPDNFNSTSNATNTSDIRDINYTDDNDDFKDISIEYLRMTALLGYLDYALIMISRYFAIQGKTSFVYVVSLVMIGSHTLLNYLLVSVVNLGLSGIVLASYSSRIISLIACVIISFSMIRQGKFMWSGFTTRALRGWKPMLKLGLSGYINVIAEIGVFEISVFCSQFDGSSAMSVIVISNQIQGVVWAIASGICCASATLIGTALGNGNKRDVKLNMVFSIANVLVISSIIAVIEFYLKSTLVGIFSTKQTVVDLFVKTFWLSVVFLPVDHMQVVLNRGILTAFGKQRFIAVSMSIICYGIGMPIILSTIFLTDLVVSGIYLGYASFYVASFIAALIRISRLNIDEEIEKTKERVKGTNLAENGCGGSNEIDNSLNVAVREALINSNNEIRDSDEIREELIDVRNDDLHFVDENNALLKTKTDDGKKEIRNVLIAFVGSFIWFVVLTGLSFLS